MFGTILEGLQNFGRGGLNTPTPPVRHCPQKQEGSNKMIRKSAVAALFGVRNEELKAAKVKVALSGV